MSAVNSAMNQGWLYGFCWYFFIEIKLSMSERIHSEMREAVLKGLLFKKAESGSFHNVGSKAEPVSFGVPKDQPVKWYIRSALSLVSP